MSGVKVFGECKVELSPGCSVVGEVTKLSNPKLDQVREVKRFLGVPYGESPVGDLMFKDPVPIKPWQGERQAKQFGPACPQIIKFSNNPQINYDPPARMGEDCLHLNVWTPSTAPDIKHPVMVWFFGGAYLFGYTDKYRGEVLAGCHGVVVVTVSYRVGVWGFLCTGDGAATGNYGLLDQVESLRWVQKNINKFGGDPNNVTIFGESAGGISVAYHIMSPLSEGLFHKAISQSGTVLTLGDTKTPEQCYQALKIYLKHLGCKATNGADIVAYLKAQPSDSLILPLQLMRATLFNPVIDNKFITAPGSQNLALGRLKKVPFLTGVNRDEGVMLGRVALGCLEASKLNQDSIRRLLWDVATSRFSIDDPGPLIDQVMTIYMSSAQNSTQNLTKNVSKNSNHSPVNNSTPNSAKNSTQSLPQGLAQNLSRTLAESQSKNSTQNLDKSLDQSQSKNQSAQNLGKGSAQGSSQSLGKTPGQSLAQGSNQNSDHLMKGLIELLGDVAFVAPAVMNADVHSRIAPVYLYSFEKRGAFVRLPEYLKADHGHEIPYVFGLPYLSPNIEFSEQDWKLCNNMMKYWTNFSKTGNPNGSGLEHWPEYTSTERKYIVLDDPIVQSADLRGQKVKFWNDVTKNLKISS